MRLVYYLNQFFGGLGGEEQAGMGLETRQGAVGPGKMLEQLLGADGGVVTTLICGDNYAVENQDSLTALVLDKICEARADLFVAGPCFLAGRYGISPAGPCDDLLRQRLRGAGHATSPDLAARSPLPETGSRVRPAIWRNP